MDFYTEISSRENGHVTFKQCNGPHVGEPRIWIVWLVSNRHMRWSISENRYCEDNILVPLI
jgi:hypothetical protein